MREVPSVLKLQSLAASLIQIAREKNITLGTAESCTGGMIASTITDVSGASAVFYGGVVSYDNSVKANLLGVSEETLSTCGAVSHETAEQMSRGALNALGVTISVAVTGLAGPGGATAGKPVGLVYVSTSRKGGETVVRENHFEGNRTEIRLQTVATALEMLLSACND